MSNIYGGWLECEGILQKANSTGDLENARECFQKTADLANSQREKASALIMVGFVLIKEGKITEALSTLHKSAMMAHELGDFRLKLRALQFTQYCYQLQGNSEQVQAVAHDIRNLLQI